ncbi:hypothetical protein GY45DRAFT_1412168, partial [Cubamyces sp. BRFM 1775]
MEPVGVEFDGQRIQIPARSVRKRFKPGDHVKVMTGSKDLRKAAEAGTRTNIVGNYELHDLVQVEGVVTILSPPPSQQAARVIFKTEHDSFRVLDQNSRMGGLIMTRRTLNPYNDGRTTAWTASANVSGPRSDSSMGRDGTHPDSLQPRWEGPPILQQSRVIDVNTATPGRAPYRDTAPTPSRFAAFTQGAASISAPFSMQNSFKYQSRNTARRPTLKVVARGRALPQAHDCQGSWLGIVRSMFDIHNDSFESAVTLADLLIAVMNTELTSGEQGQYCRQRSVYHPIYDYVQDASRKYL